MKITCFMPIIIVIVIWPWNKISHPPVHYQNRQVGDASFVAIKAMATKIRILRRCE